MRELGERGDAGGDEEHSGPVFAGRDARAAADARGRVHRFVGVLLANRDNVRVGRDSGRGNEPAGLEDLVERVTVDDQVLNDRERGGAPRFDGNRIAVLELTAVELARCDFVVRSVRAAVDIEGAHAANTFAAVVVERERFFTLVNELIVQDIQHFKERSVRRDPFDTVGFKLTFRLCVLLTPNFNSEFHLYCDLFNLAVYENMTNIRGGGTEISLCSFWSPL